MASLPLAPADRRPALSAARAIRECFQRGQAVDRTVLRSLFKDLTGASDASGAWSMRDAFDALELAQVLYLLEPDCALLCATRAETAGPLDAFVAGLPPHSSRSEQQVALEQFSTPLPLAFVAGLAAAARDGELVLEPSAGNGMLAWPSARAGARLVLNEVDGERRLNLEAEFPAIPRVI